jgi:TonB family protein
VILLVEATIKVALILAVALAFVTLLRGQSASLRHRVLSAALACAVLAPLLTPALPAWHVPIAFSVAPRAQPVDVVPLPAASTSAPRAVVPAVSVEQSRIAGAVLLVWLAGVVFGFTGLATGVLRLRRLVSRGTRITQGVWSEEAESIRRRYKLPAPVRLIDSSDARFLVVWGIRQPTVLLPTRAIGWAPDRVRLVLCHELAHVQRGDWVLQSLAEILRVVHWFNPLAWHVSARLRQESEQACDDVVLNSGTDGAEYAAHLVEIARVLQPRAATTVALAIAQPSGFEQRIRAMLNTNINRRPASRSVSIATVLALIAIALPIAALASGQGVARFAGVIVDPLNGLLPGVQVVLTNADTHATHQVLTDRDGRFEVAGLPPGRYTFETRLPGFQTVAGELTVRGVDVERDLRLELGTIRETVQVTGGGGRNDSPSTSAATERARLDGLRKKRAAQACPAAPVQTAPFIGGNVRMPLKFVDVRPRYPPHLDSAGVSGIAVLQGHIGTDGRIADLTVVSSTHPDFGAAAFEAASRWEFDATLLNCVPMETAITITVRFDIN